MCPSAVSVSSTESSVQASPPKCPRLLIWSVPHSGADVLAKALFNFYLPVVGQVDVFSQGGAFGFLTNRSVRSNEQVDAVLEAVFSRGIPLLQHIDNLELDAIREIAGFAMRHGYHQMLVYRNHALPRLQALDDEQQEFRKKFFPRIVDDNANLIALNEVMAKNLHATEQACRAHLSAVTDLLDELRAPFSLLKNTAYIKSENVKRLRRQLLGTLSKLGFDKEALGTFITSETMRDYLAFMEKSGTPPKPRIQQIAKEFPRFELKSARQNQTLQLEPLKKAGALIRHIELLSTEPPDTERKGFKLTGVLCLSDANFSNFSLLLADAQGERAVKWPLRSPKLKIKLKDVSGAEQAKFIIPRVQVNARQSAFVYLVDNVSGSKQKLFKLFFAD